MRKCAFFEMLCGASQWASYVAILFEDRDLRSVRYPLHQTLVPDDGKGLELEWTHWIPGLCRRSPRWPRRPISVRGGGAGTRPVLHLD